MTERHFPPLWSAELQPNYYVVRDANGQALSYVYYESEPQRRAAAKLLSKDEAQRIAANIAKLPEFRAEIFCTLAAAMPAAGYLILQDQFADWFGRGGTRPYIRARARSPRHPRRQ